MGGGGRGCWRGCVMGPLYLGFIVFADDHLARKFVYFTVCFWLNRTSWLIKRTIVWTSLFSFQWIFEGRMLSVPGQFQILNFFVNPNPFESGMGHTSGLHCPVLNYVWYNPWVGDELCQDIGALRWGEKKPLRFDIECLSSRVFHTADRQRGGNTREGWLLAAISMIFIIREENWNAALGDIGGAHVGKWWKGWELS